MWDGSLDGCHKSDGWMDRWMDDPVDGVDDRWMDDPVDGVDGMDDDLLTSLVFWNNGVDIIVVYEHGGTIGGRGRPEYGRRPTSDQRLVYR